MQSFIRKIYTRFISWGDLQYRLCQRTKGSVKKIIIVNRNWGKSSQNNRDIDLKSYHPALYCIIYIYV